MTPTEWMKGEKTKGQFTQANVVLKAPEVYPIFFK